MKWEEEEGLDIVCRRRLLLVLGSWRRGSRRKGEPSYQGWMVAKEEERWAEQEEEEDRLA